jgi:hypothetical protein
MLPSGTSLIDDILGKKSIKDRQQTEKCAEKCREQDSNNTFPLLPS